MWEGQGSPAPLEMERGPQESRSSYLVYLESLETGGLRRNGAGGRERGLGSQAWWERAGEGSAPPSVSGGCFPKRRETCDPLWVVPWAVLAWSWRPGFKPSEGWDCKNRKSECGAASHRTQPGGQRRAKAGTYQQLAVPCVKLRAFWSSVQCKCSCPTQQPRVCPFIFGAM